MLDIFGIERSEEELRRWDTLWLETFLGRHGWEPLAAWDPYPFAEVMPGEQVDGEIWVRKHIPVPDEAFDSVLEVGSGYGRIARLLAPRVRWYMGLDISRLAVTVARGRFARWSNVRFETIMTENSFSWQSLCYAVNCFIHLPPDHAALVLRWMVDTLLPGGWVCVDAYVGDVPGQVQREEWQSGERWCSFGGQIAALQGWMVELGLREVGVVAADTNRSYVIGRRG